jgi:enoyl-CoA hydratase/carnithine racemase
MLLSRICINLSACRPHRKAVAFRSQVTARSIASQSSSPEELKHTPRTTRLPGPGQKSARSSISQFKHPRVVSNSSEARAARLKFPSRSDGSVLVTEDNLPNDTGVKATITINNPSKLNILSTPTLITLQNKLYALNKDGELRALVITGQADPSRTASFCAGANIQEMESINTPDEAKKFISRIYAICELLRNMKAVTTARIDGLCFGAGLELAACCDFRYATERSTFSMKEVAVGIPSVVHARLLSNIMGWQAAKRMVLLGKVIDAEEAHQSSLLDGKFVTVAAMDAQIEEDVQLVASYGRQTMRTQKALNVQCEESDLMAGIHASINHFATMWEDGGKEPKQYMGAWLQRSRDKKAEQG